MNETTRSVRELYESFPYPSGTPGIRIGFDVRYLLSLSELPGPGTSKLRVLDAGCGRALGMLGAAAVQPDIDFLGIDLNRVALTEAQAQSQTRDLHNTRFAETDLEQLDLSETDFDVIHSSGVIHHLTDPRAALESLGKRLAPHGVMALMVYGHREPIQRVVRAIESVTRESDSLRERLVVAREMIHELTKAFPDDATWKAAHECDDVEFADRYLHPCECSYDIDSLFELIESSGLKFLRWADPSLWDPAHDLESDELAKRLSHQGELEQFKLAMAIRRPGKLELYLCQPENSLRSSPTIEDLDNSILCVHPEVSFRVESRSLWGETKIEKISTKLREGEAISLSPGPVASAALLLAQTSEPFNSRDMIGALTDAGLTRDQARQTLIELFERELIYAPHLANLQPATQPSIAV